MCFGEYGMHDVIDIPVIQFIIGDCKGNGIICGRKGGHLLNINGLYRDCDVLPMDGDNTYIGSPLKCKYINVSDITSQTDDHIKQYSFLPIGNCFTPMSFDGCPCGIYGGIPVDIVHAMLLGLYQYVV